MNSLNDTFIKAHGLNARRIRLHQRRILQALNNEIKTDISIEDICTTGNGSIIEWNLACKILGKKDDDCEKWQKNHLVSCIPAAGAASRFFVELQSFVSFVEEQLAQNLKLEPSAMLVKFPFLERLVQHVCGSKNIYTDSIRTAYAHVENLLKKYSNKPKLLVPATLEGDSFLKLKIEEQVELFVSSGSTLVVPFGMKKEIQNTLYQIKPKEYDKWLVLEQDHKLSTIRFLRNGEPYQDENGQYSIVTAGHGELLHLFDNIADHFEQAQCLHLRNIDNIIGKNSQRKFEFGIPIHLFYKLRIALEFIRRKIPTIDFYSTSEIIEPELKSHLSFIFQLTDCEMTLQDKMSCKAIYNVLMNLFHWQPLPENIESSQVWKLILENSEKPLSVFSVVKKEKGDMGGGPVFAKISDGSTVKLCMEMPHASAQDAQVYFSDNGKATHFNPALAFFEFRTHTFSSANSGKKVNFVQLFDERFWLLSKREHKNVPVCYHETVLYELIGNSATTNLVFIEVPRSLFKPHKSYLDCLEHTREVYGFNENFKQ